MNIKTNDFKLIIENLKNKLTNELNTNHHLNNITNWIDGVLNIKPSEDNKIMDNSGIMREYVEYYGEKKVINDFIINSSKMITLLTKYRYMEFKEDYVEYGKIYNEICEEIANIDISTEKFLFLFNNDRIKEHYVYKIASIKKDLHPEQLKIDFKE